MYQTEIKFKTMERKTKLTDGTVCYQGQLLHNHVLNAEETRQYFAEYIHTKEPQVNLCPFDAHNGEAASSPLVQDGGIPL